jgi:hypothetical protein
VRLGEHGTTEYGPQDYYIERVIVHQSYVKNGRGSSYDIAIIRISDFIPYTSEYNNILLQISVQNWYIFLNFIFVLGYLGDIQPICLPIDSRWHSLDITGISAYVAGWGSTSYCISRFN